MRLTLALSRWQVAQYQCFTLFTLVYPVHPVHYSGVKRLSLVNYSTNDSPVMHWQASVPLPLYPLTLSHPLINQCLARSILRPVSQHPRALGK